ncbi:preprotein translocase subunit SecG [Gammaproteobacteria bacterium]|jgi:preprotein translocase subunit SecG|nr:preprotein translocase subunit SecG [Gammaproteobacteria bacterium]
MDTVQKIALIVHTLIALGIIALVLLQRGKGADAGAAFGAGASGTVFGSRGSASFFSRATAVLAAAFFASSLTLAYMSSQRSEAPESLLEGAPVVEAEVSEPAVVSEELPVSDMPSLEPADGAGELPALEDESGVGGESE